MKTNLNILITEEFNQKQVEELKKLAPDSEVNMINNNNVTEALIKEADIIYGGPDQDLLKKAVNLKWLQLGSAGADDFVDKSIYPDDNIVLTNSSGVYGKPIAEHVLGMIFSFYNNFHTYVKQKQDCTWNRIENTRDFFGATMGVIGLGDIGSEIAKKANLLESEVLGIKNNPQEKPDYLKELMGPDHIDYLLQKSDIVILALPLTEDTEFIIGKEELQLMKNDAFLVNIGRGKLIEQKSLINALKNSEIGGAGLDVMYPEPLPEDSPLWKLDNIILTPHVSGLSPTNQERKFKIFKENMERFLKGEKLLNIVDFEKEY